MAHLKRIVFSKKQNSNQLPDWASEGAVIVQWLGERGLWEEAANRLRVKREGGYVGIDILLFLIFYFTSHLSGGFKGFWHHARPYARQLAALGGRKQLPSASSVSRFLSAVQPEDVQDIKFWLLMQASEAKEVLRHPSTLTRDAVGESWHIFHWDPTVTALRQRGLPVGNDLPDGKRRSDHLAQPGYTGRKRGDVQFSRATLQHSGSGLWTTLDIGPGNGDGKMAFAKATQAVVNTCRHAGVSPSRAIMCSDGAGGNVPYITETQEADIRYMTRIAHYDLLEQPDVRQALNHQRWYRVPSSGSGPEREATELGIPLLCPDRRTHRPNGSRYEPIEPRVIVSRFKADQKHGAGVWIDGWHYELFATDLNPAGWPAADGVQLYYSRCGQENRFHQEDRELQLDHVFAYTPAGQELVTLAGLFLWNFRIARGMELANPPQTLPAQQPINREPVNPTTRLTEPDTAMSMTSTDGENGLDETSLASMSDPIESEGFTPCLDDKTADETLTVAERKLLEVVNEHCDMSTWLVHHPGWHWDASNHGLTCPQHTEIPLSGIVQGPNGECLIRFRATGKRCNGCSYKSTCAPEAVAKNFEKQIRFSIPVEAAQPIGELLTEVKRIRRLKRCETHARTKHKAVLNAHPSFSKNKQHRKTPIPWRPLSDAIVLGRFEIVFAILLPATLRKLFQQACRQIKMVVSVDAPEESRPCKVYALSPHVRQQRRLSWNQRLEKNQLSSNAKVTIEFQNGDAVAPLFHERAVSLTKVANSL